MWQPDPPWEPGQPEWQPDDDEYFPFLEEEIEERRNLSAPPELQKQWEKLAEIWHQILFAQEARIDEEEEERKKKRKR